MKEIGEVDGTTYYLSDRKVHSLDETTAAEFIGTMAVGHLTEKRVPSSILLKARQILKEPEK